MHYFYANIGLCYVCSSASSLHFQNLRLLSVSVYNIFSLDIWFKCLILCCCYFTLRISFRISLDGHRNVFSWLKICLFLRIIYWLLYFSFQFFKKLSHIAFTCSVLSLLVSLFSFDWFHSVANFAAA
jgi:hypothetical protein